MLARRARQDVNHFGLVENRNVDAVQTPQSEQQSAGEVELDFELSVAYRGR